MMIASRPNRARFLSRTAACLLTATAVHGVFVRAEPERVVASKDSLVADRIDAPLTSVAGDATRGRQVFTSREGGHCVLCHAAPGIESAGNIGPALDGVGKRLAPAQLRMRIVDITRVNPDAAMPAFHRTRNLQRVAKNHAGRPILSAQQVEDLVAYLADLK